MDKRDRNRQHNQKATRYCEECRDFCYDVSKCSVCKKCLCKTHLTFLRMNKKSKIYICLECQEKLKRKVL